MLEIDLAILTNLYFSGFRYMIVMNRGDHFHLKPLMDEVPDALIAKMKCHQVSLLSEEIIDFARGRCLPAFIPDDFFEHNYHALC
jgi:hypothetical protein